MPQIDAMSMPIKTVMRDNPDTGRREAWQNGRIAYRWTRQEIEKMHTEAPNIVPAWGRCLAHAPKRSKTPNVQGTP
jgi:hypothetical protein